MGNLRSWATPLTVGSFIISTVTGILIFFHLNIGLVRPAHEWLSWFMVLGVALHLVTNWRSFKNYLHKPVALTIIGIFVILTVASLVISGTGGRDARPPQVKVMQSLQQTPLTLIAQLQNKPVQDVMQNLEAAGAKADDPNQTLDDLAKRYQKNPQSLIGAAFK